MEELVRQLTACGLAGVRRVELSDRPAALLARSEDGGTVTLHAGLASAPPAVLAEVVAATVGPEPDEATAMRWRSILDGVARARAAVAETLADLDVLVVEGAGGADAAAEEAAPSSGADATRPACAAEPGQRVWLRDTYARLNREKFAARLPADLPLRFSARMRSRYGHVRVTRAVDGRRGVAEIALNLDLLLPGNEAQLLDTLLHEMAHAEAWIRWGHRKHGKPWRRVARRVGCEPRACTRTEIVRRGAGSAD